MPYNTQKKETYLFMPSLLQPNRTIEKHIFIVCHGAFYDLVHYRSRVETED